MEKKFHFLEKKMAKYLTSASQGLYICIHEEMMHLGIKRNHFPCSALGFQSLCSVSNEGKKAML